MWRLCVSICLLFKYSVPVTLYKYGGTQKCIHIYVEIFKLLIRNIFVFKQKLDCKRTKKYINFIVIVVDSDLWLGWGYNPLERGPGDTLWLHRSCLQSYAGRIGHVVLFTQSLEKKKRWAKKGVQFENKGKSKFLEFLKKREKGVQKNIFYI